MQLRLDRWRELVRAVGEGPGLSLRELARLADVNENVLRPGYSSAPKSDTMARVAAAAADMLHLEHAQLAAWLTGHGEPSIGAFLAELPTLKQCGVCKGWFKNKRGEFIEDLNRCTRCHREKDRQMKSAASPRQAQIRAELRAQLPRLTERDPELAAAVVAALDSPEAVTMPRIAARLGDAPPRSVAARLRRSIVTLALLRMLAGGGVADATPMSRTNVPVRRDGTRRRPLTLGSGSPPPTPRRRRKGAQSAGVGYFSTTEARP